MAQYALVPGHFQAVQLVEDAKTIQDQEALIHRALRWGDKALARALVMKHGGVPERTQRDRERTKEGVYYAISL